MANLQEQLADVVQRAETLANKEGEFGAEDREQFDKLLHEADDLRSQIDQRKRLEDNKAYLNKPNGTRAAHFGWEDTPEELPEVDYDPRSYRTYEVGGREHRAYVPKVSESKEYFHAFEGYLRSKDFSELGPNDRRALSEGVDSAGGFLVPADYQMEILKKEATMAAIYPNARVVPTSRDTVEWPTVDYDTDDKYTSPIRLTWTGETPSSATAHRVTDQTFGMKTINVKTAMASQLISNNLIEDNAFDVLSLSSDLFAEGFALGLDDAFINSTTGNAPLGILAEVDGNGPTSVVSGTTATLTANGIISLYYGLPSQYRSRGAFYMSSNAMEVVEKLADSNNRYIVSSLISGASLAVGEPSVIKGRPVRIDEFMPDVSTNAYPIIFGDLMGYIIPERVGMSVQRLTERYAETNQTLLLARRRIGGYLAEPYRLRVQKVAAS